MPIMKRTAKKRTRKPREIRVRVVATQRPADATSDVWVVNGRVIRFLDPSRPDESAVEPEHGHLRHRLLSVLRPHRA